MPNKNLKIYEPIHQEFSAKHSIRLLGHGLLERTMQSDCCLMKKLQGTYSESLLLCLTWHV